MTASHLPLIRVDMGSRGRWDVVAYEPEARVASCETLDDACQIAHRRAERLAPCELVIRDAYHHVVWRELWPHPNPRALRPPIRTTGLVFEDADSEERCQLSIEALDAPALHRRPNASCVA